MRLFVGIDLPELVTRELELLAGGLPGARWEPVDKLHVTLAFIGETDGGTKERLSDALGTISMDPFTIELAGCGHFPPRGEPRIVWIGIDEREQLAELHRKIVRKLDVIGIEVERRRFAPHITIARLKRTRSRDVGEFVARHALLRSAPIAIQHFTLFSSVLSRSGSQYRRERIYPLGA